MKNVQIPPSFIFICASMRGISSIGIVCGLGISTCALVIVGRSIVTSAILYPGVLYNSARERTTHASSFLKKNPQCSDGVNTFEKLLHYLTVTISHLNTFFFFRSSQKTTNAEISPSEWRSFHWSVNACPVRTTLAIEESISSAIRSAYRHNENSSDSLHHTVIAFSIWECILCTHTMTRHRSEPGLITLGLPTLKRPWPLLKVQE